MAAEEYCNLPDCPLSSRVCKIVRTITHTVFGRVCWLGDRSDFARWCSVMTNLMQEVDGFTNQEHLESSEKAHHSEYGSTPLAASWRLEGWAVKTINEVRFVSLYLAGLVHSEERWDHWLPEGVLVVPQTIRFHIRVWCYKKLINPPQNKTYKQQKVHISHHNKINRLVLCESHLVEQRTFLVLL